VPSIKFMRDPTRGGVATVLNEIAGGQPFGIEVEEAAVPIKEEVASFCNILGFDPLYIANEGKVIFIVAAIQADRLLEALHRHPLGKAATIIGKITANYPGKVYLKTKIGGKRILDLLVGEQLPRIC